MADEITPSAEPTAAPELTFQQVADQVFGKDSPAAPAAVGGAPVSTYSPTAGPPVEPAEVVPDPGAERAASKIAAGLRAERRSAELRRERAEFTQTQQQERATIEKTKAEIADQLKLVEQLRAAKDSPSKALALLGLQAPQFLHKLATEHEPDAIAARAVSVEQTEREKLAAELGALKKEIEDGKRAVADREYEHKAGAAREQFLSHVEASTEKYPHLVEEFTPEEIVREGWRLAEKHSAAYFQKFGEYPDDEVFAEHLETQAKARAERRGAWRERIGKSAPRPSQGNPSGDLRASQPERGPSPRTLSSRQTSQRGSSPRPWTQEAADEESLRILSGAVK